MARFAVNTGLIAAFDAAARAYATTAYALAYPTGGVFFAMSPAGVDTDDHDDVTGAGSWWLCVRDVTGAEYGLFIGDAYYVKAFWLGLEAASYTPALVFDEDEPA
jgi:hypothetical protein